MLAATETKDSHLLPGVQQHHIIFIQVALGKVVHLRHPKATGLIGALKQSRTVNQFLLLQPAGTETFTYTTATPIICCCLTQISFYVVQSNTKTLTLLIIWLYLCVLEWLEIDGSIRFLTQRDSVKYPFMSDFPSKTKK